MINRYASIPDLVADLGANEITVSPYDTAWVAQLGTIAPELSEPALDWLRANQLADGSWGNPYFEYYHERLICTLAAIIAFGRHGQPTDDARIERALGALDRHEAHLECDGAGATIGFEMIVPALIEEAEHLGVYHRNGAHQLLRRFSRQRSAKLSTLPDGMINRYVSAAYSAEMLGRNGRHALDIDNVQEPNGSLGYSPAATCYFSLYGRPGDPAGLNYLREISHGGLVPTVSHIEVFEIGWGLWNLAIGGALDQVPELRALCQSPLDFLLRAWKPGRGVSYAAGWARTDGDTSGLVHEVFSRYGCAEDLDVLLSYEDEEAFFCYPHEANKSISANIHILGALIAAGLDVNQQPIQKTLAFLGRKRTPEGYWYDKWHSSPYYPTTHAIIACAEHAPGLVENAVEWLLGTQNRDGSWGYFLPTVEETAYAVQALAIWQRYCPSVPPQVIQQGARWLMDHHDDPYVPLWIGKSLYSPTQVIQSAVYSALMLAE